MLGQRNFANRMSQLQIQGNTMHHDYAFHQQSYDSQAYHQICRSTLMHQRNHDHHQLYQRNCTTMHQRQHHIVPEPKIRDYPRRYHAARSVFYRDTNVMAAPRHHVNSSDAPHNKQLSNDVSPRSVVRAIRGASFESGLFPHGDPVPGERADNWSQRGDWPRARWTHRENPTWRPRVKSRAKEYSGTELIQARDEAALKPSCSVLTNFLKNVRPQPWQLVSWMEPDTKINFEDYRRSGSSDSSSVKSGSSGYFSLTEFFPY